LLRTAKRALLPFFLCAALSVPSLVNAAEFHLYPSIAEQLGYTDNILFTPTHALHDFISTTSGGLQLLTKTEQMSLDVSGRVDQRFYLQNPGFDATDEFYKGTLNFTPSDKLSFSLRGAFNRDSLPEREFFTTGLVLNALRRENSNEGITSTYAFSEKTSSSLNYDHGEWWYRDLSSRDMTYDAFSLPTVHDLSTYVQNLNGRLTLAYTRYSFTGLAVDNYEATTGFEYRFHEKWSFLLDGGARYTHSAFQTSQLVTIGALTVPAGPIENVTATGTAPIGTMKLNYTGEVSGGALTANRDILPAYGAIGTFERTSITASGYWNLSYKLRGDISTGVFHNQTEKTQFAVTPFNAESFYINPTLRYEFTKNMYLEASYTFARSENKEANTTENKNIVFLRFYIQHPMME
jgi:hypothetical protein